MLLGKIYRNFTDREQTEDYGELFGSLGGKEFARQGYEDLLVYGMTT